MVHRRSALRRSSNTARRIRREVSSRKWARRGLGSFAAWPREVVSFLCHRVRKSYVGAALRDIGDVTVRARARMLIGARTHGLEIGTRSPAGIAAPREDGPASPLQHAAPPDAGESGFARLARGPRLLVPAARSAQTELGIDQLRTPTGGLSLGTRAQIEEGAVVVWEEDGVILCKARIAWTPEDVSVQQSDRSAGRGAARGSGDWRSRRLMPRAPPRVALRRAEKRLRSVSPEDRDGARPRTTAPFCCEGAILAQTTRRGRSRDGERRPDGADRPTSSAVGREVPSAGGMRAGRSVAHTSSAARARRRSAGRTIETVVPELNESASVGSRGRLAEARV